MSKEDQIRLLEKEICILEDLRQKLKVQLKNEEDPHRRDEIRLEIRHVDARLTDKGETLALVKRCTHRIPGPTQEDWDAITESAKRLKELEVADAAFHQVIKVAGQILKRIPERKPVKA